MHAGRIVAAGALAAFVALAGCTSAEVDAAVPTTPPPATSPTASGEPSAPTGESPALAWADGTPVTGPDLDVLAAARTVSRAVEVVRPLEAPQGWRPAVRDLKPDGTALVSTIEGDVGTGAGPVGEDPYGPPAVVGTGTTTLTVPDEPDGYVDRATFAAFVDDGVAWVETAFGDSYTTWRLLVARDGATTGTVVAEGDDREAPTLRELTSWAAVDDEGALYRYDGDGGREQVGSAGTDVDVTVAGDDLLVTTCDEGRCDVSVLSRDGAGTPLLTMGPGHTIGAADERHVVVADFSTETAYYWVLDRGDRTAVRVLGDRFSWPSVGDGRLVLTTDRGFTQDDHDVLVVDLATLGVERLLVPQRVGNVLVAGDHVAWTTTQVVDTKGQGGAVLRWPRGA